MGRISVGNTKSTFSITQINPNDWDQKKEVSKSDKELNEKLEAIRHEIVRSYHKRSAEGEQVTASSLKSNLEGLLKLDSVKFKMQYRLKNHPVPEKKYIEAFKQHFKCSENNFEIKQAYTNGPFLVKYEDSIYKIDSHYDLEMYVKELLTTDAAMYIPVNLWVEIAEDIHSKSEFLIDLATTLNSDQEINFFNTVLNMCQISSNPIQTFWYGLESVDYTGQIYPKAINVVAKHFDLDILIEELSESLIHYGDEYLNEMQNGIFEYVDIEEFKENSIGDNGDRSEEDIHSDFYIYTVDDVSWER